MPHRMGTVRIVIRKGPLLPVGKRPHGPAVGIALEASLATQEGQPRDPFGTPLRRRRNGDRGTHESGARVIDPKVAILMVRRDESGSLFVVDANGKERSAETPQELSEAVHGVLDDPELPEAEQIGSLENAAEKIVAQAAATLLPEVAKPLAGPLVRDIVGAVRSMYAPTEAGEPGEAEGRKSRPPTDVRAARRRSTRIRSSRMRLGGTVKRKGNAA